MEPVLLGGDRAPEPGPPRMTAALEPGGGRIAHARHLTAEFLDRVRDAHGVPVSPRASQTAVLVVSELVTNAHKYAPGPVLLDLRVTGDAVDVAVWDSDPVLPVARDADPGRVGQHGLEIVRAVADAFEARREGAGKRVVARVRLVEDADGGGNGGAP